VAGKECFSGRLDSTATSGEKTAAGQWEGGVAGVEGGEEFEGRNELTEHLQFEASEAL